MSREDEIFKLFEQIDPENKIGDEKRQNFITAFIEMENNTLNDSNEKDGLKYDILELKKEIDNEEDWRKRASIAAKIISLGL
jgi:hypothetical protein